MANVRLVAYRKTPIDVAGTITANVSATTSPATIPLSFTSGDATGTYFIGDVVLNTETQILGTVQTVNTNSIVLNQLNFSVAINDTLRILRTNTYNLDLQQQPNISLNYQFADIKEPEKRKASFSQTFKLPFTDINNDFFENFYNVNLQSLVFSTHKKFEAALYVGTVLQFEGVIQLKAVYKKAGLYEVVLLSNGSNLFTLLGNKKVRDAWTDQEKIDFQFIYNNANLQASWVGNQNAFQNTNGVSFRDTDVNVNKVMFPFQVNMPNFYYPEEDNLYLKMSNPNTVDNAINYVVPIYQFKPAIQLKTILKQIFNKVGYTYTSTFLDSDYFGKLFMTTCNHTGKPSCTTVPTPGQVDGEMNVTQMGDSIFGITIPANMDVACNGGLVVSTIGGTVFFNTQNSVNNYRQITFNTFTPQTGFNVPTDTFNLYSQSLQAFHRTDNNMVSLTFFTRASSTNMTNCGGTSPSGNDDNIARLEFKVVATTSDGVEDESTALVYENILYGWTNSNGTNNQAVLTTLPLDNIPIGQYARIYARFQKVKKVNTGATGTMSIGAFDVGTVNYASDTRAALYLDWDGLGDLVYDLTVDTINGIDPDLTQKAFLKDLIQRFNLVVIPDNDNPTNLFIEPYNDFISGGTQKFWTNKLDTSKEIIVKDTTSLQKSIVKLSDSEDVDLMNKSIKEFSPSVNVFGNINIQNTNNEFAQGELKYESPFAPYINQFVYASSEEPQQTLVPRCVVQYEFTYKQEGFSYIDSYEKTKPKLFYYSGKVTQLFNNDNVGFYLHNSNSVSGVIESFFVNKYPLCSPYEMEVINEATGTIGLNTKSLYFSQQPSPVQESPVFSGPSQLPSFLVPNSLYFAYWSQFFNLIYNENTKIVECHLYLNEVDIFDFKFNDEIFIQDTYYRILDIKNYQVGETVSTKVTLITQDDDFVGTCQDCDYVISTVNGQNNFAGRYIWCPDTNPNCNPDITANNAGSGTAFSGLMTTKECCDCVNGDFFLIPLAGPFANLFQGAGLCSANSSSLAVQLADIYRSRNLIEQANVKSYFGLVTGGYSRGLSVGTNRDKYARDIVTSFGDDIKIKYSGKLGGVGSVNGESHRFILLGKTTGNTKSFAYVNGNPKSKSIVIPSNSIVNIRLKGISTVIGGYSANYPLGSTEAFAYFTAFAKIQGQSLKQLGAVNGTPEYALKESGVVGTCTMEIDTDADASIVRFGIKDLDADAIRTWQISVDYDVNIVPNTQNRIDANDAQFQNLDFILLQNEERLQWN
tara:strand:- start:3259 stop:7038 length:3780 start_codon:yes stop_codon:yes gene_type:complete